MRRINTSSTPAYTVYKAIKGAKGPIVLRSTFTDESAAMEYAWTCVNLLNMSWAEVWHNGERVCLHVAA